MYETLLVTFFIVAIALVIMIMLQQGKGADMGSSFKVGHSYTLFNSGSSTDCITRATTILAILFFSISLALDNINCKKNNKRIESKNINALENSK